MEYTTVVAFIGTQIVHHFLFGTNGGVLAVTSNNGVISVELFSTTHNYDAWLNKQTGILYLVSRYQQSWYDARSTCWGHGGTLLMIKTDNVQQFMIDNVRQTSEFYIGGRKQDGETQWKWLDGQFIHYFNGNKSVPTPDPRWNYCIVIFGEDKNWVDEWCGANKFFICQLDVPSGLRVHGITKKVELEFDGEWGTLCFKIELSNEAELNICNRVRNTDSTSTKQIDWYDNQSYTCTESELHCEGTMTIHIPEEPHVENNTYDLSCVVANSILTPYIVWTRAGTNITTALTIEYNTGGAVTVTGRSSLPLTRDDNGTTVICITYFSGMVHSFSSYTFNVLYAPKVGVGSHDKEINEGDSVNIVCNITSNPHAVVTWLGPHNSVISSSVTLTISQVSRSDTGNYTCKAENMISTDVFSDMKRVMIHINAAPKMCLLQQDVNVYNQNISLTCAASGIPRPAIAWYYQGNPVNDITNTFNTNVLQANTPSVPYISTSTLLVSKTNTNEDIKGYECRVNNKNGETSKMFHIRQKLQCRCRARIINNCVPVNVTMENLSVLMEETKATLTVDRKSLTSFKIRKISIPDDRMSSRGIGALGIAILVIVTVLVVLFDISRQTIMG